jgi:hypothetical protein
MKELFVMLAFAKDITDRRPRHIGEDQDSKLNQYMDYQRKLNNVGIVNHSLKYGKDNLKEAIHAAKVNPKTLEEYLAKNFPCSSRFADASTLLSMIKKMHRGHNNSSEWYKMNPFYLALFFDCLHLFVIFYNQLIQDTSKLVEDYTISGGAEIDFEDWTYLYFNDLDFHIGVQLNAERYPFSKRNHAIEEAVEKEIGEGKSQKEAYQKVKSEFEMDKVSIKVVLGQKIGSEDLELFHTPIKNPIYEYLRENQKGSWDSIEGESLMDQAYSVGSRLKVWVWKKKKGRW